MRLGLPGWDAGRGSLLDRGVDVLDAQSNVVQTGAVGRQPCLDRVILGQRLDQLQVRVAHVEMGELDRTVVDDFAKEDRKAVAVAPDFERLFCIGDGDGDVIDCEPKLRDGGLITS